MIGKEVGPYRIIDRLGGGGMGVVYRAEDTRLGRIVALKFLSAELLANETLRKRFLHEARAASLIDHPNVCHVYEVGEADDGRAYMAMSYCEGRSLREVINSGPVPPREAFSVAFGVAQGLWAAHRRGIVHRDIKPANVILTDEGFVRIVDFGLALLIDSSRVTTTGVTVGTVAYMSPEQTSNSQVSPNTDIWSLGVTLYEMLTGKLPFRGDINAALLYSIVHEPPTPLADVDSSIPKPCVRIVDRCLEKDPAKRYQTIEELLEDMVRTARELGWESSVASATIAPILEDRRKRVWRKRIVVGAMAVLVVAGGVWAYREFWPEQSPYTTDVRLAVMPFRNLIGPENEALADGLGDHITRVARWTSRGHDSMWVVPYSLVMDAQLAELKASSRSFGANMVIVGDIQRVGDYPHVHMKLLDATSEKTVREASLRLDIDSTVALMDSLPHLLANWLGVDEAALPPGQPWCPHSAGATRPYLEGLSSSRRGGKDSQARLSATASLGASLDADSMFAAAAYAAGYAEVNQYYGDGDRARIRRALEYGRGARRSAPELSEASLLLGNAFRLLEQPDSAEACYQYANRIDPSSFPTYERLGNLYASQNRLQESERSYLRAITATPDYWVAHRFLGAFYYEQRRLEEAEQAWLAALRLAPDDVLSLNNLGVAHYYLGEWPEAQGIFLRSFRIHPDCNSCNNVATALFLDGRYGEAASYFELALSPEYCDSTQKALGNLASALYWVDGSRPRSIALYRRAIALAEGALTNEPESAELIARLIDYYAMSGDSVRARDMIARAEPFLDDNNEIMYRVGSAFEKLGDRSLAMHHLGNAVRHGYALPFIESDPVLRDLVVDPIFKEMTRTDAAAEGARAASDSR